MVRGPSYRTTEWEYSFQAEWLKRLRLIGLITSTCVALKLREPTGLALVQSVSQLEGQVIFAPGPRGLLIPKDRLEAIYDLHPILHVNEAEALAFQGVERSSQPSNTCIRERGN